MLTIEYQIYSYQSTNTTAAKIINTHYSFCPSSILFLPVSIYRTAYAERLLFSI